MKQSFNISTLVSVEAFETSKPNPRVLTSANRPAASLRLAESRLSPHHSHVSQTAQSVQY